MEQVKRNSREFKDVKDLIVKYVTKSTRKKLIMLYAIKPAQSLSEKILINTDKNAEAFYDLTYDLLLNYLDDTRKKLFRKKHNEPFYYFKTTTKSKYIELPFEFTGKLKQYLFPLKIEK